MKLIQFLPFYGHGSKVFNLFGHPYFIARSSLNHYLSLLVDARTTLRVLDVGCGSMPYRSCFPADAEYHGLEIDQERNHKNSLVSFFYDGSTFPLEDEVYDYVICSQVLEHSFTPEMLLQEIARVLKPGGMLLLTIPFLWPEHEQPYDSQRFTSFGLLDRLRSSGFPDARIFKLNCGLPALIQLSIDWVESLVRPFVSSRKFLSLIWRFLLLLPYTVLNLIALLYRVLFPSSGNSELFLDLALVAQVDK